MLAAAAAGADIVDVAIDSGCPKSRFAMLLTGVTRHVRVNFTTIDGSDMYGT